MATYDLIITVTSRTQTGSAAGTIKAGLVFESNTSRMIRDALHRKIENGQYMNLYVPASACAERVVTPPPPDPTTPPAYEITEMRRRSYDGGLSWTEWEYFGMNKLP